VAVEGGILPDHLGDVCHRDSDDRGIARSRLGHRQLIEIFRVVVVDGAPQKLPQVAHLLRNARGGRVRALGFGAGGGRELRLEAALEHGGSGNVLQSENR
jgi:hypothetical protein